MPIKPRLGGGGVKAHCNQAGEESLSALSREVRGWYYLDGIIRPISLVLYEY